MGRCEHYGAVNTFIMSLSFTLKAEESPCTESPQVRLKENIKHTNFEQKTHIRSLECRKGISNKGKTGEVISLITEIRY